MKCKECIFCTEDLEYDPGIYYWCAAAEMLCRSNVCFIGSDVEAWTVKPDEDLCWVGRKVMRLAYPDKYIPPEKCPSCGGSGKITVFKDNILFGEEERIRCERCNGTGIQTDIQKEK